MLSRKDQVMLLSYVKGLRLDPSGLMLTFKGAARSVSISNRGYKSFNFGPRGDHFKYSLHRFQAFQKYGIKTFNKTLQVRHLDNNKLNNSWNNIALGTPSQNQLDRSSSELSCIGIQSASVLRKWTPEELEKIILDRRSGMSYSQLIDKWGGSKSTMSYLFTVEGKRKASFQNIGL